MIDPTKLEKLNLLANPLAAQHAAVQTSFTDMVGQMMVSAGSDTMEANLLQDWSKMVGIDQDQVSPSQPGRKKLTEELTAYLQNPVNTANPLMNATPPGVDNSAAADHSNTGSINQGQML